MFTKNLNTVNIIKGKTLFNPYGAAASIDIIRQVVFSVFDRDEIEDFTLQGWKVMAHGHNVVQFQFCATFTLCTGSKYIVEIIKPEGEDLDVKFMFWNSLMNLWSDYGLPGVRFRMER